MSSQRGEREQRALPGAELLEQSSQCRLQHKERNRRKVVDAQGSGVEHCGMVYNNIMDSANLE